MVRDGGGAVGISPEKPTHVVNIETAEMEDFHQIVIEPTIVDSGY